MVALLGNSATGKMSITSIMSKISADRYEPSFCRWETVILLLFFGSFPLRKYSVNNQKVFRKKDFFF